jgi:hypothetical protein
MLRLSPLLAPTTCFSSRTIVRLIIGTLARCMSLVFDPFRICSSARLTHSAVTPGRQMNDCRNAWRLPVWPTWSPCQGDPEEPAQNRIVNCPAAVCAYRVIQSETATKNDQSLSVNEPITITDLHKGQSCITPVGVEEIYTKNINIQRAQIVVRQATHIKNYLIFL